jgi:uncharacterized protein YcaQ
MPSRKSRKTTAPDPVADLTWTQVLAWRISRQHLTRRAPREAMRDVVAALCGVHAQLMSSAELTLWARVAGLGENDVADALWRERSLVKTWAMRGTLHLLPTVDLPHWVAAQSVRPSRRDDAAWLRYFGLSVEEFDALLAAIPAALGNEPRTREELADAVAARVGSDEFGEKLRDGFGTLLKPAAFAGLLCFGPDRDRRVTFVAPSHWLSTMKPVGFTDRDEAIRRMVGDYLAVYGPATRDDFARWFGLRSAAQAGRLLAVLGDEVVTVNVEDHPHIARKVDVAALKAAEPTGSVRLLPAFDQYVVTAPRDCEAVLPSAYRARVYRPQAWLSPVVLHDGRMVGTWRHERKGGTLQVAITPFAPLPNAVQRAAEQEGERLTAFLGGTLALRWEDT